MNKFALGMFFLVALMLLLNGCQDPDPYYESLNHPQACTFPVTWGYQCPNNPGCLTCTDEKMQPIESVPEMGCTVMSGDVPGRFMCVRDCAQCALDKPADPQ